MKKITFLFLMALLPLCGSAYTALIDGIYYNFNTEAKTATVTYNNYNNSQNYTGKIIIPATVNYNGVEYTVANIGGDAFRNCISLTSVTIPGSVTSIGSEAFWECI